MTTKRKTASADAVVGLSRRKRRPTPPTTLKSPRLKLRIPRNEVAQTLTALLSRYEIEDVSVQDRPLEEVIAEVFQQEVAL